MRLLSKKDKSGDPFTSPHAAVGNNASGSPISAKSERGGTKARSSLTKLLNGIDRSYHGSKFSSGRNGKYGKDSGPSVAELLQNASKDKSSIDEEDPYETSTSPETIRSVNGNEHDLDDIDEINNGMSSPRRAAQGRKDMKRESSLERRRWTIDTASHEYHSSDNDDLHEPRDRDRIKPDRARERGREDRYRERNLYEHDDMSPGRDISSNNRRDNGNRKSRHDGRDPLRKSRHGGADALRSSRHGATIPTRSSTGDLSRSRHGGGNRRGSAGSMDDFLSKSRHGGGKDRDRDRTSRDRKKSDGGDGLRKSRHGLKRGQQVVDALRRSLHGDEGEDKLKKSLHGRSTRSGTGRSGRVEAVVDALRRSLHGSDGEDGLRRSRHGSRSRGSYGSSGKGGGDMLSKSRHGDSLSKSRHGDSLSKSRHGEGKSRRSSDKLSKSRHGGSSMSRSRHGGTLSKRSESRPKGAKDSSSLRKSRHGGGRNEIKDLLAPSRHGARLSSELNNELRGAEESTPSVCCVCGEPAKTYLQALNKKFHHECFNCVGCHEPIDPAVPFTYMSEGGEKHPLHMSCHSELYGMKCTVCLNSIPAGADGKIKYTKHPFFSNEVMCPTHIVESVDFAGSQGAINNGAKNRFVRRCTSCHRFEPFKGKGFLDLGDLDRCVCMACCRTIVCDSVDAQPLWRKVLKFWEKTLNMPIWEGMKEVPILVVGSDVMTEQVMFGEAAGTTHHHSGMTRGLCLSEQQATSLPASVTEDGKPLPTQKSSELTAILCLTGLPSDLTASVLAHEAMHAWFKLHPEFGASEHAIPAHVEEGCAQLIAHLYLTEREASSSGKKSSSKEDGPSDEMLRQYFKFSIESDASEIYGDGFRQASRAYSEVGLEMLLNHVAYYRDFPET